MKKTVTKKTTTDRRNFKISKNIVALIVAAWGLVKYNRFINFIDNLKLGLRVLSIENGYAVVAITNLNTRHIPYEFAKVDLLLDKSLHIATNNEESTNLSIVPFSNIPINFRLLQNVKEEDLQLTEIAITYKLFGIYDIERLYKPEVLDTTSINTTSNQCGCNNH